jgi:hypothetical protein
MSRSFSGILGALEAERKDGEALATIKRRKRIEEARDFCRPFMADHLDVAAMSLILLREERGVGNVSRAMVRERCRRSYPDLFNEEAA